MAGLCADLEDVPSAWDAGKRGTFAHVTVGIGHGNGRGVPMNFRQSGSEIEAVARKLVQHPAIEALVENQSGECFC